MATTLPVPHLTEVDGVATVWVDAPGPLQAGLVLRVGSADETFTTHGATHLLEHLALFGIGRPGEHGNGCVGQTDTTFTVEADADHLVRVLSQVTRQLHEPPLERLPAERDVLRAEAASRPPTLDGLLLSYRYGATTYALADRPESALDHLSPDDLAAWAARYAVRQNAVLWLTGPPPAGLRLHLPDGAWQPAPDPTATILPSLRAWFGGPDDVVALDAVADRSPASAAVAHLLAARLVDELRTRRAIAYSPDAVLTPLTGSVSRLLAVADLVPGMALDAVTALVGVLQAMAVGAVGTADLEEWRARLESIGRRPHDDALTVAQDCAFDLLHRAGLTSPEQWQAQASAVTVADVVAAAQAMLTTAIVSVPDGAQLPDHWTEAPASRQDKLVVLAGTTYRSAEYPAVTEVLTLVDDEGLMLHSPLHAGQVTVRADDTAGVLCWPDGRRVVVGVDGMTIDVEPTLWVDGQALVAGIDALFPAGVRVRQSERRPEDVPLPQGITEAGGRWFRWGPSLLLGLLIVAMAVVTDVLVTFDQWWAALLTLALFVWAGRRLGKVILERRHLHALAQRSRRAADHA